MKAHMLPIQRKRSAAESTLPAKKPTNAQTFSFADKRPETQQAIQLRALAQDYVMRQNVPTQGIIQRVKYGKPKKKNAAKDISKKLKVAKHKTSIGKIDRPSFTSNAKKAAFLSHNLNSSSTFTLSSKPNLTTLNAAMPHRISYKNIRDNTISFVDGTSSVNDFKQWTDKMINAGKEKIKNTEQEIKDEQKDNKYSNKIGELNQLLQAQKKSQQAFETKRNNLLKSKIRNNQDAFIKEANSFHANVPDIGPHFGVNNPVQDKVHLNLLPTNDKKKRSRSPSPMSRNVMDMDPKHLSQIPVDDDGDIITTSGATVPITSLDKKYQKKIEQIGTTVITGYDPNFKFGPTTSTTNKPTKMKAKPKSKKITKANVKPIKVPKNKLIAQIQKQKQKKKKGKK
jgi:hypothetical protein